MFYFLLDSKTINVWGQIDFVLTIEILRWNLFYFSIYAWNWWPIKRYLFFSEFNKYNTTYSNIYNQQDAKLHSFFYLETSLHVSGGTTTHHQKRKQLYLQHLVFVRPLLLPAAGNNNGVTNIKCCRYNCLSSWLWVVVPTETFRAVSR